MLACFLHKDQHLRDTFFLGINICEWMEIQD